MYPSISPRTYPSTSRLGETQRKQCGSFSGDWDHLFERSIGQLDQRLLCGRVSCNVSQLKAFQPNSSSRNLFFSSVHQMRSIVFFNNYFYASSFLKGVLGPPWLKQQRSTKQLWANGLGGRYYGVISRPVEGRESAKRPLLEQSHHQPFH